MTTTNKRGRGRPTLYTAKLGADIAQRLTAGTTLRRICRDTHMPHESTVRGWARNPEHPFYARYQRVKEARS